VVLASLAITFASAAEVGERVCQNCTNESTEPYVEAPAPWDLDTQTAYIIPMLGVSPDLPVKAFAPLERTSAYAKKGTCLAGVGLMLIVRYKDSPVGPYDEFIIIPGLFANTEDPGLPKFRISRIYVSHKYTTWNGRRSKFILAVNVPRFVANSKPQTGTSRNTWLALTGLPAPTVASLSRSTRTTPLSHSMSLVAPQSYPFSRPPSYSRYCSTSCRSRSARPFSTIWVVSDSTL